MHIDIVRVAKCVHPRLQKFVVGSLDDLNVRLCRTVPELNSVVLFYKSSSYCAGFTWNVVRPSVCD